METPSLSLEPLACFIGCLPCGDSHTVIVTTSSDIVHPGGRKRRTETGVAGPILSSKVGKRGVCKIPRGYRPRIA